MERDFMDIDGGVLEGGGQILRVAVSLSAILRIPIRVTNIRAGRKQPGLKAQHLEGIKLVAQMCGAEILGTEIGSTEIQFKPGNNGIMGGEYYCDTKTAGSTSLLVQVALPVALFARDAVSLRLRGGTNADMAPQIDYLKDVFRHMLYKFGADFSVQIDRRGYFPRGGGSVLVSVSGVRRLQPLDCTEPMDLVRVKGWCYVAGTLPFQMAADAARSASDSLLSRGIPAGKIDVQPHKERPDVAIHNGCGLLLSAELQSGCVLGTDAIVTPRGDPRQAAARAANDLADMLAAGLCADHHLQDQMIIYMALAAGRSALRVGEITLHTRTAIHIAETIAKVKFTIREEGATNVIECEGLTVRAGGGTGDT